MHARPLLAAAVFTMGAVVAVPLAQADMAGNSQGCTPGYWKQSQHFDSWQDVSPETPFGGTFGLSGVLAGLPKDLTMLDALNLGGGKGLEGARQILARAATAAYLNAAYDSQEGEPDALLFPWRRWDTGVNGEAPLLSAVEAALSGTDREAMLRLAAQLDAANNLGCPLS